MKRYSGSMAACVLTAIIILSLAPAAAAAPRGEKGRDRSAPVVRILKKLQQLLGIGTQDNLPIPPRPDPAADPNTTTTP